MTARLGRGLGAVLLGVAVVLTGCGREVDGRPVAEQHTAASSAVPPAAGVPVPPAPPAPAPPSDEDQIRQAIQIYQDSYNTEDWDAYLQIMCPAMREQYSAAMMDLARKTREENGLTTATVVSVSINGDDATATIEAQNERLGQGTIDLPMKRSDGWKVCKVA